jgi:hypothetical protein
LDADTDSRLAWRRALCTMSLQALDDLECSGASEVVFVRGDGEADGAAWFDELERGALAAGFACARVGLLSDRAFDRLEALVGSVARHLRRPGEVGPGRGLCSLLDAFAARADGRRPDEAFARSASRGRDPGDLTELCRAYLGATGTKARARARVDLDAWLAGTSLERAAEGAPALATLGPATARRALGELTRVVRALGARGTLLLFENAHLLARLPAARREATYVVLRELIDNAEGAGGLVATRAMLFGLDAFYRGRGSLGTSAPLATRVLPSPGPSAGPVPPHHPFIDLVPPPGARARAEVDVRPASADVAPLVGALVRASFGVPSAEPLVSTTVGYERIDAAIGTLFAHSAVDGSVFALVTGAYGAGKTHLIAHLTARALADRRPLLRLSLERLDVDLGNPQRHLRRLLAQSTLPADGRPGPLDRLDGWCRAPGALDRVRRALAGIEAAGGAAATAAARLRRRLAAARRPPLALERFLGALELVDKPSNANYRQDAYGRLLLWLALLEEVEGCAGPVLIIDEAENLFRPGVSRAERRTALRSLAFYCGGALPRACVVLAVTPEALARLRDEAGALLDEIDGQSTLLAWEDASMLRRRLAFARPLDVPPLGPEQLAELAERWRLVHGAVRGTARDDDWPEFVRALVRREVGARALVRAAVERLERSFWAAPRDERRPRARHEGAP